jgi:hypothetical protein
MDERPIAFRPSSRRSSEGRGVIRNVSLSIVKVRTDPSDGRDAARLAAFVDGHAAASIFHLPGWNRVVQRVFGTDFTYLMALDGDDVVGAMPCHIAHRGKDGDFCYSPPRLHEVSYGGPLVIGERQAAVAERLVRAAAGLGKRVTVDIFNAPENSAWLSETSLPAKQFETAYVDLTAAVEEIWRGSLDTNRRNMIRKAEKSGVEIVEGATEDLETYLGLARETAVRGGFHPPNGEYYDEVLKAFSPAGQTRLLLARREGETLAGGLFLRQARRSYYWLGASTAEAGHYGQGEALQWAAIQWAKASGCETYDLVGIERDRLPHIARFKLGFTKRLVPFSYTQFRHLSDRVVLKALRTVHARTT